jgi:hypothetical protein
MEYILGIVFVAVVAYLLLKKKDESPTQLEVEIKAVEPEPLAVVNAAEGSAVADVEAPAKKKPAAKKAPAKKAAAKKTTSKKA